MRAQCRLGADACTLWNACTARDSDILGFDEVLSEPNEKKKKRKKQKEPTADTAPGSIAPASTGEPGKAHGLRVDIPPRQSRDEDGPGLAQTATALDEPEAWRREVLPGSDLPSFGDAPLALAAPTEPSRYVNRAPSPEMGAARTVSNVQRQPHSAQPVMTPRIELSATTPRPFPAVAQTLGATAATPGQPTVAVALAPTAVIAMGAAEILSGSSNSLTHAAARMIASPASRKSASTNLAVASATVAQAMALPQPVRVSQSGAYLESSLVSPALAALGAVPVQLVPPRPAEDRSAAALLLRSPALLESADGAPAGDPGASARVPAPKQLPSSTTFTIFQSAGEGGAGSNSSSNRGAATSASMNPVEVRGGKTLQQLLDEDARSGRRPAVPLPIRTPLKRRRSVVALDSSPAKRPHTGASAASPALADRDALAADAVAESPSRPMAPRLVLAADGSIVVDRESLTMTPAALPGAAEDERFGRVVETSSQVIVSHARRVTGERWSAAEMALFYECLSQFGTDFTTISENFPGKTRKQVYAKFKKEEKANLRRVELALSKRKPIDIERINALRRSTMDEAGEPSASAADGAAVTTVAAVAATVAEEDSPASPARPSLAEAS